MDFRAPRVKSVADFLMYLFQDRKLQPSTIDGYRSVIADKLGNSSINVSKDEKFPQRHTQRPEGNSLLEPLPGSTLADKGSLGANQGGLFMSADLSVS